MRRPSAENRFPHCNWRRPMAVPVSLTRITHPPPTPLLVPPHPHANQVTFQYLRATAEPQRSKIRSSRRAARPLASPAAQASPDQSAHQRQAAVAPRLWGTTTPAEARLQSPVPAQTVLE